RKTGNEGTRQSPQSVVPLLVDRHRHFIRLGGGGGQLPLNSIMITIRYAALGMCTLGLVLLTYSVGRAQSPFPLEGHAGHMEFHSEYEHWKQPNSSNIFNPGGVSCCNARKVIGNPSGYPTIIGDCYPTEFRLLPGGKWEAQLDEVDRLRTKREWIPVPD